MNQQDSLACTPWYISQERLSRTDLIHIYWGNKTVWYIPPDSQGKDKVISWDPLQPYNLMCGTSVHTNVIPHLKVLIRIQLKKIYDFFLKNNWKDIGCQMELRHWKYTWKIKITSQLLWSYKVIVVSQKSYRALHISDLQKWLHFKECNLVYI